MARLIDADALSLPMIGDGDMQGRYAATMGYRGQGRVLAVAHELHRRMIAEAPTVDAVEVVRCKNCKYWNPRYETMGMCMKRNAIVTFTKHDYYCAFGERKKQ